MPTLTLNGATVPYESGATILEAARAAGIDIPTLCWYPKLPIVGNCRVCLVSVKGQGKLLPACATPAAEGMVVETESPAAIETRRGVLGLLLMAGAFLVLDLATPGRLGEILVDPRPHPAVWVSAVVHLATGAVIAAAIS